MNTFEMARRALVNDLIESAPPEVVIEAQLEVVLQLARELEDDAKSLRLEAEALLRRLQ